MKNVERETAIEMGKLLIRHINAVYRTRYPKDEKYVRKAMICEKCVKNTL